MYIRDQNGAEQVIVFVPTDIFANKNPQDLQRHDAVMSSGILNNLEFVEGYAETDTRTVA